MTVQESELSLRASSDRETLPRSPQSTAETQIEATDMSPAASPVTSTLAKHFNKNWFRILLLVLIGVAVRAPALSGERIWDDQYLALENPFIKSPVLILEAFRHHLFLDSFSGHYRPVQNISFIFDYFFWNTDPYGFHLTNVLLHVASGVLLYLLLRKLLHSLQSAAGVDGDKPASGRLDLSLIAWFVALLWTVHPVHSAAVDYISGRADSLAFLFACGAWLLVLAARSAAKLPAKGLLYLAAALAAVLALCSREIAAIWLAIFLLHLLIFEKRVLKHAKVLSCIGCLGILAAYAGLRALPENRSRPETASTWTAPTRAVLMLRALGDYGRLMIFPSNLHMERSVADQRNYTRSWRNSVETEYLSIAGVLVLAAFGAGFCCGGRGQRLRIFGAAWFLLAYLPISNLFELNATAAEHWLYLPSVGFLLFLAGCCIDLPLRYARATVAFSALLVICFSARSVIRSGDWLTAETFYERTVAAGGSSPRVAVNLAIIYSARGEHAKAEAVLRDVLRKVPDDPTAKNNLADVLLRQGKKEEAEATLAASTKASVQARKEYPRTWIAALNLARLRQSEGDTPSALQILATARLSYPRIWEIARLEAELIRRTQGPEAALGIVQGFVRDNWWHYGASIAAGRLLAEKGDVEPAAAAFRQASRLDVHEVEGLNLIAGMRVRQNELQQAYDCQRRAVARQPHQPRQYLLLSDILEKMGRSDEARAMIARVERMHAKASTETAAN